MSFKRSYSSKLSSENRLSSLLRGLPNKTCLFQQYALKEKEDKLDAVTKTVDVKEPEKPVEGASDEVPIPSVEVLPTDVTPLAAEESTDATADEALVEKAEDVSAAAGAVEETTETSEEGNSGDEEPVGEEPEIKVFLTRNTIIF